MSLFSPNECFVCKTTENLQRCRHCKMISYCGFFHETQHSPEHRQICELISSIMKERGVSHIFEGLRYTDSETWQKYVFQTLQYIEAKLNRDILEEEMHMFLYPRVCFVCYDTREEFLKNCPRCPFASFCKDHPSSRSHDENCFLQLKCYLVEMKMMQASAEFVIKSIKFISEGTQFLKAKVPDSMREYLDHYVQPKFQVKEDVKIRTADYFTQPLRIFGILKKINHSLDSRTVIHMSSVASPVDIEFTWETLLHFLPDLKDLRIVLYKYMGRLNFEYDLCKKCKSKRKTLSVETVGLEYWNYINDQIYQKPDIFVIYNFEPPNQFPIEGDQSRIDHWNTTIDSWSGLTCPIILTIATKKKLNLLRRELRSLSGRFIICYDRENNFVPLRHMRNWETRGVSRANEFVIVLRNRDQIEEDISRESLLVSRKGEGDEIKEPEPAETLKKENEEPIFQKDNLSEENLMLRKVNRLLKENLLLKDEHDRLENENLDLKEENHKLLEENKLVKTFRPELKDLLFH